MKLIDILFTGATPRGLKVMKGKRAKVKCFLCQRWEGNSTVNILQKAGGGQPQVKVIKLHVRQFTLSGAGLTIRFMACQECNCILRLLRGNEPGFDLEGMLKHN